MGRTSYWRVAVSREVYVGRWGDMGLVKNRIVDNGFDDMLRFAMRTRATSSQSGLLIMQSYADERFFERDEETEGD